jgi:arabinofuranan 3-O-arabinosyltransferase
LTIAIVLSVLAVLAAIALAILDRRRQPLPAYALPRLDFPGTPAPRPALVAGAVAWIAAAGLLVGPAWMLAAAVGSVVVLGVLRRPRLAGVVTVGILAFSAVVVVYVVRHDQPFPNAGWPVRFDWLHGLGLFAAVSLLPAAAGWPRRRPRAAPPSTADSADEEALP